MDTDDNLAQRFVHNLKALTLRSHSVSTIRWLCCAAVQKHISCQQGCVNRMVWNDSGTLLLSGSDDCDAIIWGWGSEAVQRQCGWSMFPTQRVQTGHTGNIFGVAFLAGSSDSCIATCAMDGEIRVHDITRGLPVSAAEVAFTHHGFVRQLETSKREGSMLWSIADDGVVAQWDHRQRKACPIISLPYSCNAVSPASFLEGRSLAANPTRPHLLAVAASDAYLRVYDRRMLRPVHSSHSPSAAGGRTRLWSSACEAHLACERFAPFHLTPQVCQAARDLQHTVYNHEESMQHYPTHCCWDVHGEVLAATYSGDAVYTWRVFQDPAQGAPGQQGGGTHTQTALPTPSEDPCIENKAAVLAAYCGFVVHAPLQGHADAGVCSAWGPLQGLQGCSVFLQALSLVQEGGCMPTLPHALQQALLAVGGGGQGDCLPATQREARGRMQIIEQQCTPDSDSTPITREGLKMAAQLISSLLQSPPPEHPWQQAVLWELLARGHTLHNARPMLQKAMHFAGKGLSVSFLQFDCVRVLVRAAAKLNLWSTAHQLLQTHLQLVQHCLRTLRAICVNQLPAETHLSDECDLAAGSAHQRCRCGQHGSGQVPTAVLLTQLRTSMESLNVAIHGADSELRDGVRSSRHPLHSAGTRRASVQRGNDLFTAEDTSQDAGGTGGSSGDPNGTEDDSTIQSSPLSACISRLFGKAKATAARGEVGGSWQQPHQAGSEFGCGSSVIHTRPGLGDDGQALFGGSTCPDGSGIYVGARNADTDIKECRIWEVQLPPTWAALSARERGGRLSRRRMQLLLSGSDDGCVYVWSRGSGRLLARLPSDPDIVNCIAPHPTLPVLAVSGISHDISLWVPGSALGAGAGREEGGGGGHLADAALDNIENMQGAIDPGEGNAYLSVLLDALRQQQAAGGGEEDGAAGAVQCPQQ